jgi:hypothetical protein
MRERCSGRDLGGRKGRGRRSLRSFWWDFWRCCTDWDCTLRSRVRTSSALSSFFQPSPQGNRLPFSSGSSFPSPRRRRRRFNPSRPSRFPTARRRNPAPFLPLFRRLPLLLLSRPFLHLRCSTFSSVTVRLYSLVPNFLPPLLLQYPHFSTPSRRPNCPLRRNKFPQQRSRSIRVPDAATQHRGLSCESKATELAGEPEQAPPEVAFSLYVLVFVASPLLSFISPFARLSTRPSSRISCDIAPSHSHAYLFLRRNVETPRRSPPLFPPLFHLPVHPFDRSKTLQTPLPLSSTVVLLPPARFFSPLSNLTFVLFAAILPSTSDLCRLSLLASGRRRGEGVFVVP